MTWESQFGRSRRWRGTEALEAPEGKLLLGGGLIIGPVLEPMVWGMSTSIQDVEGEAFYPSAEVYFAAPRGVSNEPRPDAAPYFSALLREDRLKEVWDDFPDKISVNNRPHAELESAVLQAEHTYWTRWASQERTARQASPQLDLLDTKSAEREIRNRYLQPLLVAARKHDAHGFSVAHYNLMQAVRPDASAIQAADGLARYVSESEIFGQRLREAPYSTDGGVIIDDMELDGRIAWIAGVYTGNREYAQLAWNTIIP